MDLGNLSQGSEALDIMTDNVPALLKSEQRLVDITTRLHYNDYETHLEINGGNRFIRVEVVGSGSQEEREIFADKCRKVLEPIIAERNAEVKERLIVERQGIISSFIRESKES